MNAQTLQRPDNAEQQNNQHPQKRRSLPQPMDLAQRVLNNRNEDAESLCEEVVTRRHLKQYGQQAIISAIPIIITDVVSLMLGFALGLAITSLFVSPALGAVVGISMAFTAGVVLVLGSFGLYGSGGMHPIYEFRQLLIGTTLVISIIALSLMTFTNISTSIHLVVILALPFTLLFLPIFRSLVRIKLAKSSWWGIRSIVFDADRRLNGLYKSHLRETARGLRPVGFVQDSLPEDVEENIASQYLGSVDEADQLISKHKAHVAIVHRHGRCDQEVFDYISEYLNHFSRVVIVPDDERLPSLWSLGQNGGLSIENRLQRLSSRFIKRSMDIAISLTAIITLMPVFIGLAIWTKLTAPGPLFFGHERIGKHGLRFKAWKFRTMVVNADEVLKKTLEENPEMREEWEATYKLQDDPRITKPGKILRKTSLDEIPQLWNVLMGEMSLVGPRPIVVGEVERYKRTFKSYLQVAPGVTGFWQVSGRNLTTYDRRVQLDGYYVRNWSVWFDLYIIGRTAKTVLLREGAF